jgi:hypothetical protein
MKRTTVWRIVLASCIASLCLLGWGVVEVVRWVGSLMVCV